MNGRIACTRNNEAAPEDRVAFKPKILFLVDRPGWAYDTASKALSRCLDSEFTFEIEYVCEQPDLSRTHFDLIHVFFWGETYHERFVTDSRKIIKEISSHRWANEDAYGRLDPCAAADKYLGGAATLTATSKRLQNLFSAHRRVEWCPNGFDPGCFNPPEERRGPLRIGWAGNKNDPCKGLVDVLVPAVEGEFELAIAGGDLDAAAMGDFYRSIDVLCVASTAEGEPLTLVEGMACGCFPVCVDVGIVPELVRHTENGLIVERSANAFREAFRWCVRNLATVRRSGAKNADLMLRTRTWERVAPLWSQTFKQALTMNTENRRTNRRSSNSKPVALELDQQTWRTNLGDNQHLAQWPERARAAASLVTELALPAGASILDLGCGHQTVRPLLPAGLRYFPVDCLPRTTDTLVMDLARDFPGGHYDAAVMLGLLEYLDQPLRFLARVAGGADHVVFSYNDDPDPHRRTKQHWKPALRPEELTRQLESTGGTVLRRVDLGSGLKLYSVRFDRPGQGGRTPTRRLALLSAAVTSTNSGDAVITDAIRRILAPCAFTEFALLRTPSDEEIEQINSHDAAVICGTNLFQHTFACSLDERVLRRIKVPIIPLGVGASARIGARPVMKTEDQRLVRLLHERCEVASVRDPVSLEFIQSLGIKNVELTGCPVLFHGLANPSTFRDIPAELRVAIRARLLHVEDHWRHKKMSLLHRICRELTPTLVLQSPYDLPIAEELKEAHGVDFIWNPNTRDAGTLVDAVTLAGRTGGFRLHFAMLGLSHGRPATLIGSDTRVSSFAEMMGLPWHDIQTCDENLVLRELHEPAILPETFPKQWEHLRVSMANALARNGIPNILDRLNTGGNASAGTSGSTIYLKTPVDTIDPNAPVRLAHNVGVKLPRILLIADVPDWIFERHCRTIAENLRDEFDFDLAFNNQPFSEADYDLIYALEFNLVNPANIRNPSKYVTGVRSHLSWTGRDMMEFARFLRAKFQKVHMVSQRLLDVFAPLVPRAEYLTHGVDTSLFQPTRPVSKGNGALRVGWAGNRNTSAKGFAEFIEPLGRLPGVELIYCGYVDRNLSREEMLGFYDDIDVYVCSSATEGNNNSLMEAAAMERALVTTDTGTVPEFLVDGESALIVPRTVKTLVKSVERLRDDPALRVKLGKAARLAVQSKFEWSDQFPTFRDWFKSALENVEPTQTANASRNGAVFEPTLGLAQIENQIREALAINPDGVEALRLLAGICLQGDRWVESANAARRVIELKPDDLDALSILAKCFFKTGDIESTRMVLERILALDPANEMARDNLAALETETLSDSDRAGKLEQLLLAGREAVAAGNVTEAIRLLESAAQLAPQDADLCVAIANLLIATGDIETARRRLSQALTIDANHAEAGRMLVELALGDIESKPATGAIDAGSIRVERTPAATAEVPDHALLTRGPLVSVIVPTCNRPEWLRETLESILAQTYRDFEIILVNDAGSDVSHVVAGLAAEDRIRLINHEANKGLAGARNTGVRAARGKYIAYLDDDDIFHPDHLAVLVTELENSNAAVAYSDAHRATQELRDGRHTVVRRDVPYSHDFDADRFLVANYVPVLCFLHERRCFDETGFFDESLTTHEDWDLWMRMSRKFSFRHVAKVTCEFRWRDDGSSMSSARKADFVRTADIIYRKYPEMTSGRPDIELRRQHHLHAVSNAVGEQSGIATPLLLQVSIVIPVFNKLELTRTCLEAIYRETAAGTFEIIVVDNGSTDGTAKFLAAEQTAGRLRTIRNEQNLGFSKACNQGIRAATGGFILLLNNDTVPLPGWLDALLREAVTDPNIGAVGSCLLYPDGERIQHAGVTVGAGKGLLHPYHIWRLQRLDAVPAAQQSRDRQVCTGACLLIRRPVLDQVGLLDEGYVNGFEDVDLCFRIGAAGHRIRYCAASRVLHHESMTPGRKRHEQANYRRLNERWGKHVQPDESNVETALNIAEIHSLERLIREPDNHCALALLVQVAQRRGDKAGTAAFTKRFNAVTHHGKHLPVTISIVIPVLNNLALTRDCITGINRAGGLTPVELIVVDNASTDGTAGYLNEQQRAGNLRFIRNAKNEGFARACNQGAALARGRFVLFLNNDTVPTAGWLDALWQASLDPAVGAVGARLLYADGTLQHAGIGWINGVPDHPLRHQSGNHPEASQFRELDMVTGACLLVPRELFLRLGGFDECYINGVEDIDLCLRVRAAGHKVVYQPEAVVYHLEGKTAGRFDHVSKNLQKFSTRWKGWFDQSYRFLAPAKPRFIRSEKTVLPASTTAIPSTDGKLRINWEGSFLDHGSLSNVNRALTDAVERAGQTVVGRVSVTNETPTHPRLKKYRSKLSKKPAQVSVTVRHAWPPKWNRPDHGKLAVIQPWEFGALPVDWVKAADQVDEFWVPSAFVRELYVSSGIAAAKVKVLANGVDVDRFHPKATPLKLQTDKAFKFLFVGGTIFRKGPDLLLKAYLESFTAQDDVCLVIKDFGGDSFYAGQTIADSIREAQKNPDAPEILYLDRELSADEMPGLYTACDCLVLPYRGEGFGLPVLEAMACGLPVVVTAGGPTDEFAPDDACYRIPSTRQVFGNQVSGMSLAGPGWLLEPNLAELQCVLKRIVTEPDIARAKGRHGAEHVRNAWTWKHSAAKAIELASALAGNPTASATRTQPRRSVELPPVARIGHLGEARELVQRKQWKPAWAAVLQAIEVRPFHPEAWLTLAEIALNTGNGTLQKECVDRARTLAPAWKRVKEFTKQHRSAKSAKGVELSTPPGLKGTRLSVCLITKNEEQFLGGCLLSIRDVADQIVVVDTGSTDRTIEIARENGAEVHAFTWCDDFSAARNAALEHATGDWVLMLDADEELDAGSIELLRLALTAKNVIGYRLPITDMGREAEGCTYVPRLFRNAPGLFYICRVHEQVFSSVEARRQEWNMELGLGEPRLIHHGYTEVVVKDRNKVERNLRLLEKAVAEMPDEPNLLMNYGLELVRSGERDRGIEQYELALQELSAKPAAEITPEIRETLLTQMGSHYLKAKRWDSIVELYDSPLARTGGLTASMHFTCGLALQELGRWADSADHFRQAIHKRNDRTFYLVNELVRGGAPRHCLANSLWKSGDLKGAEKDFEKALQEAPELAPLKLDHARFLADTGRTVDALKQLNEIVALDGASADAWLLGAEIALSDPAFLDFAFDWTGEAVRLLPANGRLQIARARTLVLAQRYADALPLLRELNRKGGITAEQLLCELMRDEFSIDESPADERETSHAFLQLYRRLVQFGCAATVEAIHERLELLATLLPSAAAALREVLDEVATTK